MRGKGATRADRALNPRVLVSAASLHGATAEIAQAIGQVFSRQGFVVTVVPPEEVDAVDDYDAVIIGSAVYAGHWLEPAKDFVDRFRDVLPGHPVWLFSSGPVGDPSGKLARAMGKDPVDLPLMLELARARGHRMFAGKLDRRHLSLPQRAALLVFRGLEGDFRDWDDIRQWAEAIVRQLALAPR